MSDENVQVDPVMNDSVDEVEPKTFDEAYVKKLRDEAASYRVRLKEHEDAQKTEAEKLADRIAELEKENSSFRLAEQRAVWAREIVKGSSVPVEALRGESEEELRAHFEQLKSLIPVNEGAPKAVVPIDLSGQPPALNSSELEDVLRGALGIR